MRRKDQLGVRKKRLELAKDLREAIHHQSLGRAYRKRAARLAPLVDRRFGFLRESQKTIGVVQSAAANLGQNEFPGGNAVEQRRAQFSLQSLDVHGHAGLRITERSRRARK